MFHTPLNVTPYIMRSFLWRYQARVSRISICKIPHLDSSAAFLSIPAQSMSVHADATRFSCSCASRDTDVDAHAASCQAASDFQCTGIRSGFANHSSRRSGSERSDASIKAASGSCRTSQAPPIPLQPTSSCQSSVTRYRISLLILVTRFLSFCRAYPASAAKTPRSLSSVAGVHACIGSRTSLAINPCSARAPLTADGLGSAKAACIQGSKR